MYICRSLSDDFVMKLYYKECHHRDMTIVDNKNAEDEFEK